MVQEPINIHITSPLDNNPFSTEKYTCSENHNNLLHKRQVLHALTLLDFTLHIPYGAYQDSSTPPGCSTTTLVLVLCSVWLFGKTAYLSSTSWPVCYKFLRASVSKCDALGWRFISKRKRPTRVCSRQTREDPQVIYDEMFLLGLPATCK